ncbi:hypothetical protein GGQ96_000217 [Sphingomonas abaci]|uniref:Uncharacterized protein n=1 Tax=Sphingomonas abaci TaxID=237611 RepID=A0A7W7EWI6_9SPHN|nr:hypothetical protein [Sphingomonas abaci]
MDDTARLRRTMTDPQRILWGDDVQCTLWAKAA